jgi:8-oxo-dGTP diphosphatase
MASDPNYMIVTAALVQRDGRFLVTRRLKSVHLAGYWEFPGGKCEPHEEREACLHREILEELGVDVVVNELVYETSHAYEDRVVELYFFNCTLTGEPRPLLGQDMRWVPRTELRTLEFPPADTELIEFLSR